MAARRVYDQLLRGGHEAVWEELELYYRQVFEGLVRTEPTFGESLLMVGEILGEAFKRDSTNEEGGEDHET